MSQPHESQRRPLGVAEYLTYEVAAWVVYFLLAGILASDGAIRVTLIVASLFLIVALVWASKEER